MEKNRVITFYIAQITIAGCFIIDQIMLAWIAEIDFMPRLYLTLVFDDRTLGHKLRHDLFLQGSPGIFIGFAVIMLVTGCAFYLRYLITNIS
ncbi:MAG: hypothetical protein JWM96_907 [Alphaproteobacteria bacterium]|nr:hypothetical protein [Alphaproteobacteria bacterium]